MQLQLASGNTLEQREDGLYLDGNLLTKDELPQGSPVYYRGDKAFIHVDSFKQASGWNPEEEVPGADGEDLGIEQAFTLLEKKAKAEAHVIPIIYENGDSRKRPRRHVEINGREGEQLVAYGWQQIAALYSDDVDASKGLYDKALEALVVAGEKRELGKDSLTKRIERLRRFDVDLEGYFRVSKYDGLRQIVESEDYRKIPETARAEYIAGKSTESKLAGNPVDAAQFESDSEYQDAGKKQQREYLTAKLHEMLSAENLPTLVGKTLDRKQREARRSEILQGALDYDKKAYLTAMQANDNATWRLYSRRFRTGMAASIAKEVSYRKENALIELKKEVRKYLAQKKEEGKAIVEKAAHDPLAAAYVDKDLERMVEDKKLLLLARQALLDQGIVVLGEEIKDKVTGNIKTKEIEIIPLSTYLGMMSNVTVQQYEENFKSNQGAEDKVVSNFIAQSDDDGAGRKIFLEGDEGVQRRSEHSMFYVKEINLGENGRVDTLFCALGKGHDASRSLLAGDLVNRLEERVIANLRAQNRFKDDAEGEDFLLQRAQVSADLLYLAAHSAFKMLETYSQQAKDAIIDEANPTTEAEKQKILEREYAFEEAQRIGVDYDLDKNVTRESLLGMKVRLED